MASEQSALTSSLSGPAATLPIAPAASQHEAEIGRTKSLKRGRADQSQNPASLTAFGNAHLLGSPSPKSPRYKGVFSPGMTPVTLTGAAALADQQREESLRSQTGISENPGQRAISSLMSGAGTGMSRPQDAPLATTTMSEGMSTAARAISIPSPMTSVDKPETSPASVMSLASLASTAPTTTANPTAVTSPVVSASAVQDARDTRQEAINHQQPSQRHLTFPGNMLGQPEGPRAPPRGVSLPMPGQQLAPRSPSQKKHKCPYCETEFTRHHNLKSHLLTHSQEKPYVCQTCNMRFRRLHDLKRHMKLHTGERPHICPKCDRKFARGDALARHAKGQGGCAGRRSSMGSFGDEFEDRNAGDGDAMDGEFSSGAPLNENEMADEAARRLSLPSIKAQHMSAPGNLAVQRTPSSYPPVGPRPSQLSGNLYPPGSTASGRGNTPRSSLSSMPLGGGTSMYGTPAMTESPKPLSPGGIHSHQLGNDPSSVARQRSPSLSTQFQQQNFGRGSPHPKLPAIAGLAPPERFTLPSQTSAQHNTSQGQITTSAPGVYSNRVPAGGSGDSSNNLFAGERTAWLYVQELEEKVRQLTNKVQAMENKEKIQEEKINRLSEQIYTSRVPSRGSQQAPSQS